MLYTFRFLQDTPAEPEEDRLKQVAPRKHSSVMLCFASCIRWRKATTARLLALLCFIEDQSRAS